MVGIAPWSVAVSNSDLSTLFVGIRMQSGTNNVLYRELTWCFVLKNGGVIIDRVEQPQ